MPYKYQWKLFFLAILLIYLLTSFVNWDINPANWNIMIRTLFAVLVLLTLPILS